MDKDIKSQDLTKFTSSSESSITSESQEAPLFRMEFKKIQTNQPPLLQYNLLNQLNPQLLPLFQNLLLHKMLLNLLFQSQPQHSLFNLLKTKQPLPM